MKDDIKKLLGKRIKELRLARHISQYQLAQALDIDQRRLSAIECGINFPIKHFVKIAKTFNIGLEELFNFNHLALDNNQKRTYICESLEKLSEHDLDTLYKVVKSMV